MATIHGEECIITESSVRTQLQLEDEGGVFDSTREEIVEGLTNIGYRTDGKNVWYKKKFALNGDFLYILYYSVLVLSQEAEINSQALLLVVLFVYHIVEFIIFLGIYLRKCLKMLRIPNINFLCIIGSYK